ncbi:hypothetical protein Q1695_000952 [Nippostrongylus brasiliensis]|nr:hypothetical protein Q1695_000952 [Nippostrongylus brasiliensis]
MKTTATVTRMLYKHTKRLQIKRTPKKKARVNELMKTIAMTRMPYKRTRRLINIKRSTKKKTQRSNEPTGFSSQSTAVLEDKSSLSGSDEVQDTAENEEERKTDANRPRKLHLHVSLLLGRVLMFICCSFVHMLSSVLEIEVENEDVSQP